MSEYGVAPLSTSPVHMRPDDLLATRRQLDSIAHAYTEAYLADHSTADHWAVYFAVLCGLQDGVREALETLTSEHPAAV